MADLLIATGGKTLRQFMEEMDSEELTWWMARCRVKPLDDPYWRSAMQANVAANLQGNKTTLQDFYPQRKKEQTETEFRAIWRQAVARQNKRTP